MLRVQASQVQNAHDRCLVMQYFGGTWLLLRQSSAALVSSRNCTDSPQGSCYSWRRGLVAGLPSSSQLLVEQLAGGGNFNFFFFLSPAKKGLSFLAPFARQGSKILETALIVQLGMPNSTVIFLGSLLLIHRFRRM